MTSDLAESNQSWAQGYGTGCFASLSLSFPISKMGVIIRMGMRRMSQEYAVQSLARSRDLDVSSLPPPCLQPLGLTLGTSLQGLVAGPDKASCPQQCPRAII